MRDTGKRTTLTFHHHQIKVAHLHRQVKPMSRFILLSINNLFKMQVQYQPVPVHLQTKTEIIGMPFSSGIMSKLSSGNPRFRSFQTSRPKSVHLCLDYPSGKRPSLADAQLINEVVNSVCLINSMLLLGKNKASVTMSLNTLKRRPSLGLTTSSRLVTPDEVFRLPLVHGLLPNQASRPPVFNLEVALSAQKLYPRRPQCPFK